MIRPKSMRLSFFSLFLMLMASLFAACGNLPTTTAAGSTAMLTARATPTPIPVKTQQSCPANGNGRAAVMPALTTPQHQSVAYLWQDNTHVTLSKYDTKTHNKQNLLTFSMAHDYVAANVSPDGHWIIVNQSTDGQTDALKLIRVDGKYTQTLYCAKGNNDLSGVLLSPDQHYLVFNERDINTMTDTLKLLDLSTGKIRVVLSSQQPGYPGATTQQQASRQQPQVQMSFASQLMPLSGPPPMTIYIPLKWRATAASTYSACLW
ncbi:hypothetical protein KDW_57860 [Dictyobacter vulcani]|uniref:Lipoprotein LpqB beta-propeller domain-containing protein n=1 Tax=Dictyobacter vulcani TaxID=2607529 RepID=A0A5J4KQH2_9CHLR|nr:hypothetical protein [Dictyobacter vulcani]GER91624.1 hypothetical protein KDW_57860 [Dictyobacter vulcani]